LQNWSSTLNQLF